MQALATPGHAAAHHAYLVTDHTRADEPWLVLTGDALLVGDAGRPDLHAHGDAAPEDMARALYRSIRDRLLTLPDHLALYPAHYSGSVCGRGLSANPISTIGFERAHNRALATTPRTHSSPPCSTTSRPLPRARPRSSPPTAPGGRSSSPVSQRRVELGLRENLAQFSLLVAINAFVGAMVGLERSTLPLIGREDFGLTSKAAVLSFIVAFGLAKALTNLAAGSLRLRAGRRRLLIAGWAIALPVPLLIALAPSWEWVVAANVLLGVNQGLAWSMTVVMKIDLVGPERRGFALGLNEAAGYGGVALAAAAPAGWRRSTRPDVLVVAAAVIAVDRAPALSVLLVRDTAEHVALEQSPAARRRRVAAAAAARRSPTRRGAGRRCARARRPAWSTTSTTRSRGAWSRCSSPRTAPASPRSG